MRKFSVVSLLIAALLPAIAWAEGETAAPLPQCNGNFQIVRVSGIKPGGSMDGFLKAVEAHKAWYKSHGFKDNEIRAEKIMMQDPATHKWKDSDQEIMVVHVRPPQGVKRDAAWESFVKQYADNSEIKSERFVCVPKSE
jgi:hypothetical protein